MRVRVVTPPEPVVSFETAARHLRLDGDEDRELVEGYIASATAWIDGPAGWLGRSLGEQVLELIDGSFGGRLPYGPVLAIEGVFYTDPDDVEHEVPDTDYRLLPDGTAVLRSAVSWPVTRGDGQSVRVVYRAGYPDAVIVPEGGAEGQRKSTVPAPIRQAILLLVSQWYMAPEAVNVGNIVNEMPFAVEALLAPYRVWR